MKLKLLSIILLFTCFFSFGQEDAWVYFTDKQNVAASIANPISILTQKAIDRKAAHNVAIDARDVPINPNYEAQIAASTGITVLTRSKWFNAVHVQGLQTDIANLLNLSFVASVEYADRSLNVRTQAPIISKFERERSLRTVFNYGNASNQIQMINGDQLHLSNYTGAGMTVAVIDAGFPNVNTMGAFQRLRDAGNLMGGYDFLDKTNDVYASVASQHGTEVLSTMAGYIAGQFVGTAPDAKYYLFRTEDAIPEGPIEESLWVAAAERADSLGVDVINTSLGYKTFDNPNYNYTDAQLDGQTAFITRGANIASEKGMLLLNSAGNSGASGVGAPADSPNILSIGAVDASGNYVSFSSQGSAFQPTIKPDVAAQGSASAVIDKNNSIITASGTSFSSPILTGGVVCLWQALPTKSNVEIMQLVRESASQFSSPDYLLGYGIPDLQATLNTALAVEEYQNETVHIYPNPTTDVLHIEHLKATYGKVTLFDSLGRKISQQIFSESITMNVKDLTQGLYILTIQNENGVKTFKILKE